MKPVNENTYTTDSSSHSWFGSIVKPYINGWTTLKRAFGPVNQLRADNLANPPNSVSIGTKLANLAHRIKFIGLAIPLLFPVINIIPIAHNVNQIYIRLFFNEDVKKDLVKKEEAKEREFTSLARSQELDPNILWNSQEELDSLSGSQIKEDLWKSFVEEEQENQDPSSQTPEELHSPNENQINEDLLKGVLEEEQENQDPSSQTPEELNSPRNEDLWNAVLIEDEDPKNQDPSSQTPEELESLSESQINESLRKTVPAKEKIDLYPEKNKKPVPLHIELFNKALELQTKKGSFNLLQVIENLVNSLNIVESFEPIEVRDKRDLGGGKMTYNPHQVTQKDNLKIQLMSYLANPNRLFNEIQNEFNEKREAGSSESMMDLLKNKIQNYNLYTFNALKLDNDQAVLLYNSEHQLECLSFAVFANSEIGRCKIETVALEKAVLDRIIDSLLDKSSTSPSIGIGEQMNKEIESFLKGMEQPEEKKREIWTDFANTYVSRFVAPFLQGYPQEDPLDSNRVGLMTRFEEEIGSKTLHSNFEEFQQMMLATYLTKQKSVLAKEVQSRLNQIGWNEPKQKTGWLNFGGQQSTREQLIIQKQKKYLDDLKENIKTILAIDFPKLSLSDAELDQIIKEMKQSI